MSTGARAARMISILAVAIVGCGPHVVLDENATEGGADSSDGDGTPSTSSQPPAGTSDPVPPPPTTAGDATAGDATSGVVTSATSGPDVDDGESIDDGCFFLCGADGGTGTGECDLFAQDCPPEEKCMPWANDGGVAWNATRCSPLFPSAAQVGEPCTIMGTATTGIDDCEVGALCWHVNELGEGVCEDLCTGSADTPACASPSDRCAIANDGTLAICLSACDPLLQDCAVPGDACDPVGDHWVCVPDGSAAPGGHGTPCDFVNACDPGLVCIGASDIATLPGAPPVTDCDDAVGCCAALCDASDPLADADCAALDPAHTCEVWLDPDAPPPGNALGVCGVAR